MLTILGLLVTDMSFLCPVCGYHGLTRDPVGPVDTFEICECCGFEFGFDDKDLKYTYHEYRLMWLAGGAKWFSSAARPASWSLERQIASLPMSVDDWKAVENASALRRKVICALEAVTAASDQDAICAALNLSIDGMTLEHTLDAALTNAKILGIVSKKRTALELLKALMVDISGLCAAQRTTENTELVGILSQAKFYAQTVADQY